MSSDMDPPFGSNRDATQKHRISFLLDENRNSTEAPIQLLPVTATVLNTKKNSASNFLAAPQLVVHATTMDMSKDWTLPPLQPIPHSNNNNISMDKLPSISSISIPEVSLGKPNSDPTLNQWFASKSAKTPTKNLSFPLSLDEKLLQQTHLTDEQASLLRQISATMTHSGHHQPTSQKLPSVNNLAASRDSAKPYLSADEYIESYMSKIRAKTYCTILLDVDSLKQEDKKIVCPFSKNCRKQIKGKGNFRKHIEWHLRKIEEEARNNFATLQHSVKDMEELSNLLPQIPLSQDANAFMQAQTNVNPLLVRQTAFVDQRFAPNVVPNRTM